MLATVISKENARITTLRLYCFTLTILFPPPLFTQNYWLDSADFITALIICSQQLTAATRTPNVRVMERKGNTCPPHKMQPALLTLRLVCHRPFTPNQHNQNSGNLRHLQSTIPLARLRANVPTPPHTNGGLTPQRRNPQNPNESALSVQPSPDPAA